MSDFPTHIIRRLRHKAFGAEERIVLFVLADRMQKTTDVVWPSVETIASDCGMSERGVRYVIGWLVSVGALVEVEDGRRTRSFRIDFERIACLPDDVRSRSRKENDRHGVPGKRHQVHLDRHPVQEAQTGTPCPHGGTARQSDRHAVHPRPAPGAPKGISEGTMKEPVKDTVGARAAAPPEPALGPLFESQNPTATIPASTSIPATEGPPRNGVEPADESLPVPTSKSPGQAVSVAKTKRVRKQTKSRTSELTEEQSKAFKATTDCFTDQFFRVKKQKPILSYNGRDRKVIEAFLAKLNWDSAMACEIIRNAFADPYYRERFTNFDELLKNTTRYQGKRAYTPTRREDVGTMQFEPGDSWVVLDNPTLEEIGS